jgi:hypothetical protein
VSALADALAPLYREYLRRLEEMAARIGEEAALREPLLRDDAERPVRNDETRFLTRFDLADARSGETFEVHGARPDDPAVSEVVVEGLPVHLDAGNWEELAVRCIFQSPPASGIAKALANLIEGWAFVAAEGCFATTVMPGAAPVLAAGWSCRLHSATVRLEGNVVAAVLDLGTCPPVALDALAAGLAAFGHEIAPLARVVVGGTPPKDS